VGSRRQPGGPDDAPSLRLRGKQEFDGKNPFVVVAVHREHVVRDFEAKSIQEDPNEVEPPSPVAQHSHTIRLLKFYKEACSRKNPRFCFMSPLTGPEDATGESLDEEPGNHGDNLDLLHFAVVKHSDESYYRCGCYNVGSRLKL
jgi:hypothetical protein